MKPAIPRPWDRDRSGLAARMRAGVTLNVVGAVFNQGSTFAVNVIVANLLGRQVFGEYTMVLATVATLATVGQLSMGYTATKHVAEFRTVDPPRASRILGLCAIVAAAAAALAALALAAPAPWLAASILEAPHLAWELRLAAVAVFFTILTGFFTGALAGLESYRAIAKAGVVSGIVYLGLCTALAWHFGLPGAVGGVALSAFGQALLLGLLLGRESRRHGLLLTTCDIWQERAVISSFAVPASRTGFVAMPAVWIASALLARQPNGYEQLALFGAANSYRTMVLFLPHTINNVGMSLINNERRAGDERFRRVFRMNAVLTAGAAVAGAAAVLLAAVPLLALFGSSFTDGRLVLAILLVPAVLEAIALGFYQIIVSHGRMWWSLFAVALPRDSAIVLAAALLTPALGAAGLATAYGIGWTLGLAGTLAVAGRLGIRGGA